MRKIQKNKLYIGLAALLLTASCKPEIDIDTPKGQSQANFSKYVAIGNSLTSGFADGGLYLEGQKVAFPNLIADKMKAQGGGEFNTPFFSEEQSNGSGYLRLSALVNGQPQMANVTDKLAIRGANTSGGPLYTKHTGGEINNLGVPGMRLDMAFAQGVGTTLGNPYFERLLPDGESPATRYFEYSTSKGHTFFSFWLGNNDALGYATNGAVNSGATSTLTPTATFTFLYNQYINELTKNGEKGIVATIPDVTAVPYFTTVTRAALLAAASAAAGAPIADLYIATKTGPRPATDNDLFVLPFSSSGLLGKPNAMQIPYGFHPLNPVEDQYVLDQSEVTEVKNRVNEYNNVIKDIATSKGLAIADVHSFLNKVKTGYAYNGIGISNKFITGNAFSLDGIHLTPIGNAIVANLFIDAINAKYGSSLEKVDATKYRGVIMP